MRFTDFLRAAVLLFAGAATALAAVSIAGAQSNDDTTLLYVAVSWWAIAAVAGMVIGRRPETSQGIGRLLADARHSPTLPEQEPGRTMFNRLWPLLVVIAAAAGVAFLVSQGPAIGGGYAGGGALGGGKEGRGGAAFEDRG